MYRILFIAFYLFISITTCNASLTKEDMQDFIEEPLTIGKKDSTLPVWEVLNKNKELHSYIFETYDYAQIPGFSGGKMNLLVQIDLKGDFLDIVVLEQDEPVFNSGIGLEPFVEFLTQYKGRSLKDSIKIRVPRGPTSPVHIDGVTKATASVYIANDLILGASVQVAKEKLFKSAPKKIFHPKKDLFEKHTWKELLDKKLVTHIKVTKAQMEQLFEGTESVEDLSDDEKSEIALDLYIADISIPTLSKNLLKKSTQDEINKGLKKTNEAILVFANGPYTFISDDFVPGTSPSDIEIKQDGFSLNILDGNYDIEFWKDIPEFSQTMLLQVDKRYDFDPSSLWTLNLKIVRGSGSVFSSPITRFLTTNIQYPKKYFNIPKMKSTPQVQIVSKKNAVSKTENSKKVKTTKNTLKQPIKKNLNNSSHIEVKEEIKEIKQEIKEIKKELKKIKQHIRKDIKIETKDPIWMQFIYEQKVKLISLTAFLSILFVLLYKYQALLAKLKYKRTILLSITLFFIGWYGQGQLSIVTVLGVIKTLYNSGAVTFLLYDPFSLIIWFFVLISLFIWGRGTFCGWLCPYGVLQEFSYNLGRLLKLPTIKVSNKLNNKLVYLKYVILVILLLSVIFVPDITKYLVEIEPFKTSITLLFDREIPYVLYALFWIFLGMFLFKGFCRYFCPLGAFLSIAGKLRILDWLPRREECGNPCNNCFKNCNYQAISKKDGHIKYTDCFQCLDCVEIYSDENLCKVLVKDIKNPKKEKVINISKWSIKND